MACCVARRAAKAEAKRLLGERYDSLVALASGNRCPLDSTTTRVAYFVHDMVTLGYLLCQQGHALPIGRKR